MDYVINSKTCMKLSYIEYSEMNDEMFKKTFHHNVPEKPYKNPVVDRLACYLYENASMLKRLIYHMKSYGCIDPVFVYGKQLHITTFAYEKEMRNFMKHRLDIQHHAEFMQNWKKDVGIAIAKLSGQLYMSAGAD